MFAGAGESITDFVSFQNIYDKIVFTYDLNRINFISLFFLKSQSDLAKLKKKLDI